MATSLGITSFSPAGSNVETNPYSNPSAVLSSGGFALNGLSDLLRFKASLALRNQALREQAAADTHRGTGEALDAAYAAREAAAKPQIYQTPRGPSVGGGGGAGGAAGQAAALSGPAGLFGVRGLGNVLKPWTPGTPIGPGQSVEAMGYVPQGYGVPTLPNNSGIQNIQDDKAGLAGISEDERRSEIDAATKRKLDHAGDVGPGSS